MRRACGERLQSSTKEPDTHSLSTGDRDGFFYFSGGSRHPCLHVVNTKKNETGTIIRIDIGWCDFRNARGDIALVFTPCLARCR